MKIEAFVSVRVFDTGTTFTNIVDVASSEVVPYDFWRYNTNEDKQLSSGVTFLQVLICQYRYPVFDVIPHSLFEPMRYRTGAK